MGEYYDASIGAWVRDFGSAEEAQAYIDNYRIETTNPQGQVTAVQTIQQFNQDPEQQEPETQVIPPTANPVTFTPLAVTTPVTPTATPVGFWNDIVNAFTNNPPPFTPPVPKFPTVSSILGLDEIIMMLVFKDQPEIMLMMMMMKNKGGFIN